jgi:hypothetical protein
MDENHLTWKLMYLENTDFNIDLSVNLVSYLARVGTFGLDVTSQDKCHEGHM